MPRWLIPLIVGLGLFGLLLYQLIGEGAMECKVCVSFKGQRQCATGVGPTKEVATEEAHRSACSRMAAGVTEAFACPQKAADEVTCSLR
jgi:hypothetical protein